MKLASGIITLSSLLCVSVSTGVLQAEEANSPNSNPRSPVQKSALSKKNGPASYQSANGKYVLPPPPTGATDLKFNEFYRQPIGPRGFEYTEKVQGLDGKRVRIFGYMVKQEKPVAGCLLLTPMPVHLDEDEYGFCEDMPATVLHVFTSRRISETLPHTPGLLLLTGVLSIGNREEIDGRISSLRLTLDPPADDQKASEAPLPSREEEKNSSL